MDEFSKGYYIGLVVGVLALYWTVAELGEMFSPFNFPTTYRWVDGMWRSKLYLSHKNPYFKPKPFEVIEKTEADCRAKMLIYLIGNKLLDPKEV